MTPRIAVPCVVMVLLVWGGRHTAHAQQGATCNQPEVIVGASARYNQLVCVGVENMRLERYEEAVHDFERALTIRLHEIPNFRLFPRLALAYFKAGDREKALVNLELARLSLSVLVGIYRCYDTPSGFVLLDQTGAEVMHPHAGDVQRRMCGGAYEYVYTRQSLESFVRDAQLVEHFLAIAKEIQGTN